MQSVILFGSGSPIIVDVQESCRRRGLTVAAVIKNVDGKDYALDAEVVRLADADPTLFEHGIVVPLFTPANRRAASEQATALGAKHFPSLIDPTAILPSIIDIADGVYVNSGATIGAASRLGRFSFVNRSASLGHHFDLGDFASIGPGVVTGGEVTVGRGSVIGVGVVVLPGTTIGDNVVVAAGSVVSVDLPSNVLAAGHPARILKRDIAGYNGRGVEV
jgi:acetyltransferase-like isoleucine patch superfamily enzyme